MSDTQHTPVPWTVYRCSYCDPESACGFNGRTLDCSHDECHHPLSLDEAELICKAVNCHDELVAALVAVCELSLPKVALSGRPRPTMAEVTAKIQAVLDRTKQDHTETK